MKDETTFIHSFFKTRKKRRIEDLSFIVFITNKQKQRERDGMKGMKQRLNEPIQKDGQEGKQQEQH